VVSGIGAGETKDHRHGHRDRQGDAGSLWPTAFKGPWPGQAAASRGTGAGDGERGRGVAKWALISSVAGWAMASGSHGGLASQALRRARLILVAQAAQGWGVAWAGRCPAQHRLQPTASRCALAAAEPSRWAAPSETRL
jgi:hypothetical protein